MGFKPALNSKGLRPWVPLADYDGLRFKPALNSKGLRLGFVEVHGVLGLQASPEFKGIKTNQCLKVVEIVCASSQP